MCDQDWVKQAIADDSLVAALLLSLHQALPPPPPPSKSKSSAPHLQLQWTVRQRRSKSAPRHLNGAEKKAEPTRASPTTPLSWSGATSASGGAAADCYEESSRLTKPSESSRSEVAKPSEATTTKRSRRKKTLAELKEEETLLLKERRNLRSELASLRLTVEKHRATNESLKRMKLDVESRQTLKTATASVVSEKAILQQPQLVEALWHPSNSVSSADVPHKDSASANIQGIGNQEASVQLKDHSLISSANDSSNKQQIRNQEASFCLPDLNLPVQEDLGTNAIIHGLS